ncbi:delta 8-(e)-sphingolipid desaturase [Acrodontium crateriforme]|uniref:Delta 8-(E)-sphingolipid desaturase n=1 Tax=Acrodontium crateriforme TaxID=150365 RepID=A0AAQ3M314_9PEZI|nr:delta 8-(e)-sphingolipid desaturase [Acrodontium crateriforme]
MATSTQSARQKDRPVSRNEIEALIGEGRKIVLVDGRVLKVDAWLPYHPGGDKAILHMVGRDATNEVKAFHSVETQQVMLKYQIGRFDGSWKDFVPPIQGGIFNTASTGKSAQDETTARESIEHSDDSSDRSSPEPSPIFDPAESHSTSIRRRKGTNVSAGSSATSLSSLALEESSPSSKDASARDELTQEQLQHDLDTYPSLDPATQHGIIEKYRQLDQRIRDAGLYNCNYKAYMIEGIRYTALALLAYCFLQIGWFVPSAIFLGLFWHQLVFTVHDAGHMGITHGFHTDSCIGMFIANYLGGLSCCWWKRNHNVHHIVTNSAEHDPDIQHMPFFAVSHRFFDNLKSTYYDRIMTFDAFAKVALQYQHYLYYPILCFGRFNLYVLSWQYIFGGQGPRKGPAWWHRYFEMAGQVFFWFWFGYLTVYKSIPNNWDRFFFVLISHAVTMPVHVQITLSHFAMSTADLGVAESFPQRMLRTTMDVDCPAWLDFVHGGLQFQAVHHLFPRIPRHNLRECQKMVMEFCQDVNIPYALYGFAEGNGKVIGRLGEVAKQAAILAECQRSISVQDVLEGH